MKLKPQGYQTFVSWAGTQRGFLFYVERLCKNPTEKPTSITSVTSCGSTIVHQVSSQVILFHWYLWVIYFLTVIIWRNILVLTSGNFQYKHFVAKSPVTLTFAASVRRIHSFKVETGILGTNGVWMWWTWSEIEGLLLSHLEVALYGCCPTGCYDYILCIIQV